MVIRLQRACRVTEFNAIKFIVQYARRKYSFEAECLKISAFVMHAYLSDHFFYILCLKDGIIQNHLQKKR